MMSQGQLLLARLNASIINFECSTCNNIQRLTASDIAGALAGLPRGPYLLVRYLWCEDHTVAKELSEMLIREIIQIARKNDWGCCNDLNRLSTLVNAVLLDIKNIQRCKSCHGTGVKVNQSCLQCCGTGKRRRPQAQTARLCGVKPANWKRSWEEKYQDVYLCISEWNDRGLNHLVSRL